MTAGLQDIADAFRGSLPAGGQLALSRIDGLDRLGLPVVQAAWLAPDGTAVTGYGYGMTELEAQVGALGELCEEVHVGAWLARAPRVQASFAELGAGAAVDPLTLCLPAGADYTPDTTLSWVAGYRWPGGAPVLVPTEWVAAHAYQMAEQPRLITPITNGLGAGVDLAHAVAHGVMELLQRDGNVTSYRALDQGVVIDLPPGALPEVDGLLDRLRAAGLQPLVKLAGTELGLANIYVVGDDTHEADFSLQVSACGEASHPDAARAVRKALLEFVGSRARKAATHGPLARARTVLPEGYVARRAASDLAAEEPRALEAMAGWLAMPQAALSALLAPTAFRQARRVGLADLPSVPPETVAGSQARLDHLAGLLGAAGLGIVVVDCSPADSPVRVVRAIVPGLESETMSYHRIGWRGVARLRARGDALVLDAPGAGAERVRLRLDDEARCGGAAWLDVALVGRLTAELYPLYRECGPYSAQRWVRKNGALPQTPSCEARSSVTGPRGPRPPSLSVLLENGSKDLSLAGSRGRAPGLS